MTKRIKIIVTGFVIIMLFLAINYLLPKLLENKLQKDVIEVVATRKSKPIIEINDCNGFLIHIPDGKTVLNRKWSDMSKVELVMNDSVLVISFVDSTKQKLNIKDFDFNNFVRLIKAIPQNIKTNKELIDFKNNYFSNLTCCEICGKIAVKDSICLCCASATSEKNYNDFSEYNKKGKFEVIHDYIRSGQLFWFSTFIKNGKVDFNYKDILFDNCTGWKPLVTGDEVVKYGMDIE